MMHKGKVTIIGSMASLSNGIVSAIRAAEKAGVEIVVVPESPQQRLEDLVGAVYELQSLKAPPDILRGGGKNEPWRNRPKRDKYKKQ
jgi:hypothetical protein